MTDAALTDEILRLRKLVLLAHKTLEPFPRDQDDMLQYFDDDHLLMIAIPVQDIRDLVKLIRKLDAEVENKPCPDIQ